MPKGTRHVITGMLVRDGHNLYIRTDEGGHWRLDAPAKADRLIGQRVEVEGVRDGFDLLVVKKIKNVCGRQ